VLENRDSWHEVPPLARANAKHPPGGVWPANSPAAILVIVDIEIHKGLGSHRMVLSSSSTHALRIVAFLAGHGEGEPVQGRQIARRVKVPADYLAKVMGRLGRAGVVIAARGVSGGYRLARPAQDIKLIDVVFPFEGRRARPGCLLHPNRPCRDSGACSAHDAWSVVRAAYSSFLETTTVADIQGNA
jgi:Rrf2 family transcriptional regulator, iron-sulfur cluster assembly transcription factor